jgi:hypothetical protein
VQHVRERELPAPRVQRVVHRPEGALGGGGLGRLGGALGVRMELRDRQVAERVAQAVAEPVAHPPDDRLRGGAVRALEVAVHDELERRLGEAVDVVLVAEGRSEPAGHAGR